MKAIIVIAILSAIVPIVLFYKRDRDITKLFISAALLGGIISTAIVGNMMRSIAPLFLTHIVAVIFAYGGLIIYILRGRAYWYIWILPILTILLYLLLAWLGNEHLPSL